MRSLDAAGDMKRAHAMERTSRRPLRHVARRITFGPMVVAALRDALPDEAYLDVHLMIERPERHVEEFAKAGADGITVHAEATPHIDYTLSAIRERGAKGG